MATELLKFMLKQNESLRELINISELFLNNSKVDIFSALDTFHANRTRAFRKIRLTNTLFSSAQTTHLPLSTIELSEVHIAQNQQKEYLRIIEVLDSEIARRFSLEKSRLSRELQASDRQKDSLKRFQSSRTHSGEKLDGLG